MSKSPAYLHEVFAGRYDLIAMLDNFAEHFPYLLETTASPSDSQTNNFDILFAYPQQQLIKHPDESVTMDGVVCSSQVFLDELDKVWKKDAIDSEIASELPFSGGWFVYLGYELVNEIEPTVAINQTYDSLPIAFATRIPAAVIYDHAQDQTHVLVEDEFKNLLDEITSKLIKTESLTAIPNEPLVYEVDEEPDNVYVESVEKILCFIHEGDVFQVNLSRQWEAVLKETASDIDLYRQLRIANPAPYSAIAKFNQTSIVSSSPERLFRRNNNKIETRPIAGTRPRGLTSDTDTELQSELISNFKERAEHIMLIDLERNDLGRICKPGSIEVDEFMVLESYAHVHHIVSNVSGELQESITPGQIIKAIFPGGTITGCPKVRCMEIITELEKSQRGAYTGSLGFLNRNGDMDLNILIRSLTLNGNRVIFRAGAGIVADSIPLNELAETRAKAKGMLVALQGMDA